MLRKTAKAKNYHLIAPVEQLRFDFFNTYNNFAKTDIMENNNLIVNHDSIITDYNLNDYLILNNN
jgi:hypothetical protein